MPLGIVVAGANRHDMKLTRATLASIPVPRPRPRPHRPQHLCADKGYDYPEVRRIAKRRGYVVHIKSRGAEIKPDRRGPHAKPRRWVNERTHSWFNRFRRLLVRWEKKSTNYLAIVQFAASYTAFRAAWVFG